MADTTENLKTAFAGESQANRKYLAYAKKADKDGFPQVARLFCGPSANLEEARMSSRPSPSKSPTATAVPKESMGSTP